MKSLLIVLAAVIALPAICEAQTYRGRDAAPRPQPGQGIIACTAAGCVPVPRGCHRKAGETRTGEPSGFDVIVCPPGIEPYR